MFICFPCRLCFPSKHCVMALCSQHLVHLCFINGWGWKSQGYYYENRCKKDDHRWKPTNIRSEFVGHMRSQAIIVRSLGKIKRTWMTTLAFFMKWSPADCTILEKMSKKNQFWVNVLRIGVENNVHFSH